MNVTAYCRKCLHPGRFDASKPPEHFECGRCGDFVPISVTEEVRAGRRLDRCPVCTSAYFYREKDFNSWVGGAIIMAAAIAFLITAGRNIGLALGILLGAAALDFIVYLAVPFRYVCYKCLASIHGAPPDPTIGTYDLGIAGRFSDDYDDAKNDHAG